MAWPFDKKEGETKTPEQSKEEAAAFISQLRTSFQEDLKPLQDKISAQDQRFADIESKLTRPAPQPNPDPNANKLPSIWDDETGEAAINARLGPVAVQVALVNARMTEQQVLGEIREKGWGEFIPQIQKVVDDTPVQEKVKQGYATYLRGCVEMIVGREAMNSGLKRDPQKQRFFVEDGAGSGEGNTAEAQQLREESTGARYGNIENVDKWAQKMGISDVKALLKEPA
jgi:hypothetical protein